MMIVPMPLDAVLGRVFFHPWQNYVLLTGSFGSAFCLSSWRFPPKLKLPWWRYAVWAVLDVEANYFVVKAFQYTSITSVTLLDCFSIPCAMLLTRVFLQSRWVQVAASLSVVRATRRKPVGVGAAAAMVSKV